MKMRFLFAMLIATSMAMAQNDYPVQGCLYLGQGTTQGARVATALTTGTKNMVILFCVEQGQSDEIPMTVVSSIRRNIPSYFGKATFNNWNVNVLDVLVSSSDATTAHAFVLPGLIGSDVMVPASYVSNVLGQADVIYNFVNYDIDQDGIVDYLAFLVYRHTTGVNRGTVGLSINDYYTTNDYENGTQVRIDGTNFMYGNDHSFIERVNNSPERTESMMFHELGHSWFGWPDVDHCGFTNYNHSSFGDFDAMSSGWGGFNNVSSLYNPAFRIAKGWATPTAASGTQAFSDFDATGQVFSYTLPSYSNALSNQKYYFTYYTKDQSNHWQANWDVPKLSDGIHYAGVLVWRTVGSDILSNCTYGDRKAMPVTLEAAHGKWVWDENTAPDHHSINTGQADVLSGLDSLQERYSYIWQRYNSLTGTYENILYKGNLYQVGSASCFFAPEHNTNFAFYTNPSTNEITSTGYSRAVTPGFAMKNLRWENGQTKADFVTGTDAYTITENATLTAGTWYINNTITIARGVTLTINPGSTLRFASGSSLIVNGTLNANGNSSQRITFTSTSDTWDGIRFHHSSGTLNYCNISNATYGVWSWYQPNLTLQNCQITNNTYGVLYEGEAIPSSTVPSPTIVYCTLSNNYYGIYYHYSGINQNEIAHNTVTNNQAHGIVLDMCSSPQSIHDNTISSNGGDGVYSYYSNPGIYNNTISNNSGIGVYGYGGVSQGDAYMNLHHNTIQSNAEAIHAESGKWIYPSFYNQSAYNWNAFAAGSYSGIEATNAFNQSSYDEMYVTAYNHSNVWATGNCWMWPEGFNVDWTSSYAVGHNCMISPSVQEGPKAYKIPISANIVVSSPLIQSVALSGECEAVNRSKDKICDDSLLAAIHDQLHNGRFDEAITFSSQQFGLVKNTDVQKHILNYLAECYRRGDRRGFTEFLNNKVRKDISKSHNLYSTTLQLENGFLIGDGRLDQVYANLLTLLSNFSGDSTVHKLALFDLINMSYRSNKFEQLNKYLAALASKYPNDLLTHHAMLLVGVDDDLVSEGARMNQQPGMTATLAVSGLLTNYPNPFNPTTAISYFLPGSGKVDLKVYDLIGREVVTLVSEYQESGMHTACFTGRSLASGAYFYVLNAPGISMVSKMLMIK